MSGLGAWYTVYQRGSGSAPPYATIRDQLVASACLSIKKELVYRGFGSTIDTSLYQIGKGGDSAIRAFQRVHSLTVDGQVGRNTGKALYLARARSFSFPNDYVSKILQEEAGWDPGAQGFLTPADYGLAQINFDFHPVVTHDQAADGAFAIAWLVNYLDTSLGMFNDLDAAVVSYNVGRGGAATWLAAGKPADSPAGAYLARVNAEII